MSIVEELKKLAAVDLFTDVKDLSTFVGRPFYFDYTSLKLLANDVWKQRVGGIPAGSLLVAVYDNEEDLPEVILLRVLGPTPLPTDSDVIAAIIDYYKENVPTDAVANRLDSYTRYEFQFSGLECRVLGSFYRTSDGRTAFGADIDNFYSPNNYSVYKPRGRVLEYLVNFREDEGIPGGEGDVRIGEVRYSSSRHHLSNDHVPVYVSAVDFLGKRTALFGMTRTGKSNTLKKIVQATIDLSPQGAKLDGKPIAPIGQIIFDVNGEYANDNQQDEGTAIYQLFGRDVTRYSLLEKTGFKVMKFNFYTHLAEGYSLIQTHLVEDSSRYTQAFLNLSWDEPDTSDHVALARYKRRLACYQCILHAAGFEAPRGFTVKFQGNTTINGWVNGLDPKRGLTLDEATFWFTEVWNRQNDSFFTNYRNQHGHDWADDDLKNLLRFLTRSAQPGGAQNEAGYRKLIPLRAYHTPTHNKTFIDEIIELLRAGKIVIVDLSQGDPVIQRTYSDRLCTQIFHDAMSQFIANQPLNYVQMYFEEAHNLFPRKDNPDLTLIYNRLAKEGAKLHLGLIYATQEVSSISANVLKNTQNWFVSHLNNQDELREIAKYYDFEDFVESLRRTTDKGFVRMKTYSNAFVVPVQVDRFTAVGIPGHHLDRI
jgi:DNA helicase HerA-like ATPase